MAGVAAVTAAELGSLLSTTENLTLFAPTNDAFAAIEVQAVSDIVAKVAAGDALEIAHALSGEPQCSHQRMRERQAPDEVIGLLQEML